MNYGDKTSDYYGNPRKDIFRLVEQLVNKDNILEIGCGFGALGECIIREFSPNLYDGIELNFDAKESLVNFGYSHVFIGDALDIILNNEFHKKYDIIIMADVLEHIGDDHKMLELVTKLLNKDGHLIISVPNISNWQTLRNLYIRKTFPRDSSGIFDSTHLRWYTLKDIINISESHGLQLKEYHANKDSFGKAFDILIKPMFEWLHKDLFTSQHLLVLRHV